MHAYMYTHVYAVFVLELNIQNPKNFTIFGNGIRMNKMDAVDERRFENSDEDLDSWQSIRTNNIDGVVELGN